MSEDKSDAHEVRAEFDLDELSEGNARALVKAVVQALSPEDRNRYAHEMTVRSLLSILDKASALDCEDGAETAIIIFAGRILGFKNDEKQRVAFEHARTEAIEKREIIDPIVKRAAAEDWPEERLQEEIHRATCSECGSKQMH